MATATATRVAGKYRLATKGAHIEITFESGCSADDIDDYAELLGNITGAGRISRNDRTLIIHYAVRNTSSHERATLEEHVVHKLGQQGLRGKVPLARLNAPRSIR